MLGLEVVAVAVLGVAMLASSILARRTRIVPPVLLLVCGLLLGFVPALHRVHLPPEAVLLLFLPALLYWESLTTSLGEIRSDLRATVLLSTALVVVRAATVAAAGRPRAAVGAAWVLGAAPAPAAGYSAGSPDFAARSHSPPTSAPTPTSPTGCVTSTPSTFGPARPS